MTCRTSRSDIVNSRILQHFRSLSSQVPPWSPLLCFWTNIINIILRTKYIYSLLEGSSWHLSRFANPRRPYSSSTFHYTMHVWCTYKYVVHQYIIIVHQVLERLGCETTHGGANDDKKRRWKENGTHKIKGEHSGQPSTSDSFGVNATRYFLTTPCLTWYIQLEFHIPEIASGKVYHINFCTARTANTRYVDTDESAKSRIKCFSWF